MSRIGSKKLGMLLVLVPLLLTQGCPNSEVVGHLIGSLGVVASMSPAGTDRYETATLTLGQVTLAPTDPDAAASLGTTELGVLFDPVTLQLGINQTAVGAAEVTAGQYTIESLILLSFRFEDTTVPLPPPTTCTDLFSVLTRTFNPAIEFTDIDPPVEVTVPQDGQGIVTITIDSPGLIAFLESRFECRPFTNCVNPPAPPPCINGFARPTSADLAPYITVE